MLKFHSEGETNLLWDIKRGRDFGGRRRGRQVLVFREIGERPRGQELKWKFVAAGGVGNA